MSDTIISVERWLAGMRRKDETGAARSAIGQPCVGNEVANLKPEGRMSPRAGNAEFEQKDAKLTKGEGEELLQEGREGSGSKNLTAEPQELPSGEGASRPYCEKKIGEYLQEGREGREGKMMHKHFNRADKLSRDVIGAAMEVHSLKGPGLIESIYEKCLMHELSLRGIEAKNQMPVKVEYKGMVFEETLRLG